MILVGQSIIDEAIGFGIPLCWSSITDQNPSKLKLDDPDRPGVLGKGGYAASINNSGEIVGTILYGDIRTAVYWLNKDEKPIKLRLDGFKGTNGEAYNNNDLGEITGIIDTTYVYWPSYKQAPISLGLNNTPGIRRYGSNNNSRKIVGEISYAGATTSTIVIWDSYEAKTPTVLKDLDGLACKGFVGGINDSGIIVGAFVDGDIEKALVWLNAEDIPKSLSLKGPDGVVGTAGAARYINNSGEIIGRIVYGKDAVAIDVYWTSYLDQTPKSFRLEGEIFDISDTIVPTTTYAPPTTTYVPPTTTYVPPTTTYVPPTTTYVPPTTTAPVISNICFPAGTLITTDQGPVAIERLDTTKHSIAGDPILHVVKTIVLDKYLICFPKHSIKQHMPTQETLLYISSSVSYTHLTLPTTPYV